MLFPRDGLSMESQLLLLRRDFTPLKALGCSSLSKKESKIDLQKRHSQY